MTRPEADEGSSPSDAELRDLTDHQRRSDAAASRRREHWLREQAGQGGTLAGVLLDLGERGATVVVNTAAGNSARGPIVGLGDDFVVVGTVPGATSLVPLDAVTSVRGEPGGPSTVGARPVRRERSIIGALADLAQERRRVLVRTWSGERLDGELTAAGIDVVAVRTSAGDNVYVPLDAINDVTLA